MAVSTLLRQMRIINGTKVITRDGTNIQVIFDDAQLTAMGISNQSYHLFLAENGDGAANSEVVLGTRYISGSSTRERRVEAHFSDTKTGAMRINFAIILYGTP